MDATVWTIGHSTRSIDEFITALKAEGIETLVDVRRFPGSQRYPHFNEDSLKESLRSEGIDYVWMPDLGGRRKAKPDSKNTAWRNEGFRGYADYMASDTFHAAIDELSALVGKSRTAVMCAEAVWWRCHRGLIADYLKALGAEVLHIFDADKVEEHPYTSAAVLTEGRLTYGGEPLT